MILQVHSDKLYMNETKQSSTSNGKYFLGNNINSGKKIVLNGAIHTFCKIIGVAASTDEAELGILFLNTQETVMLCIALKEIGHTQPLTPTHTDNTTGTGIKHKQIKQ